VDTLLPGVVGMDTRGEPAPVKLKLTVELSVTLPVVTLLTVEPFTVLLVTSTTTVPVTVETRNAPC